MVTRADVLRVSRSYVGMAFRSQGRGRPGEGRCARIDCGGLVVCVGDDLGLSDRLGAPILRSDYQTCGAIPLRDWIHAEAERRLIKRETGKIEPGDFVTLRAPNSISHCGIISDFTQSGVSCLGLIFPYPVRLQEAERSAGSGSIGAHSQIDGRIVEVRFDDRWQMRLAGVFSWPGVN